MQDVWSEFQESFSDPPTRLVIISGGNAYYLTWRNPMTVNEQLPPPTFPESLLGSTTIGLNAIITGRARIVKPQGVSDLLSRTYKSMEEHPA